MGAAMENEGYEEEPFSAALNFELLSSHQSEKMMIYGLYALVNQFELHVDRITNKYKYITLTWLLATYAAIGFFFSVESKDLEINKHFVASILSILGIIGVLSIWFLDLCVYQRFWGAFFLAEANMEKRYEFLGTLTNISLSLDTIRVRIDGNNRFYSYANFLLVLTIITNIYFLVDTSTLKLSYSIILLLFGFFLLYMMKSTSKKLQHSLQNLLK